MNKLIIIQLNYDGIHTDHKGIFAEILDDYSRTVVNLPSSYQKTKEGAAEIIYLCMENCADDDIRQNIHDHLCSNGKIIVDDVEYSAVELSQLVPNTS